MRLRSRFGRSRRRGVEGGHIERRASPAAREGDAQTAGRNALLLRLGLPAEAMQNPDPTALPHMTERQRFFIPHEIPFPLLTYVIHRAIL